ncbi:MAG: hypothetical protein KDI55_02085 [Anaerolineae bacterium]|nr:hypothetical protein [Anaerolineae bacterium]
MTSRSFRTILLLYLAGLAVYSLLAGPRLVARPAHEHIALAEALLHGQLAIDPSLAVLDLSEFGGRFFVPYPPAPAALFLPAVAVFGHTVYHGVLHVLLAAAILPAFYLALRRFTSETAHSERERLWLVALLAFGTPVAALAANSNVYYTGQIAAVFFACLYLAAAWRGRQPVWAGLALGAAYLSRSAVILAFPIVLAEIWRARPPRSAEAFWTSRSGALLRFAMGLGAMLALSGLYNWLRFGNPLELGYGYLGWRTDPEIVRWGLFSYTYLERNLHAALTSLPVLLPAFPFVTFNPEGLSLLITTPVLVMLPFLRGWTRTAWAALLSSGLIFLTALLYANTGFAQYGYRYAADFLPFLILAMALAGLRVVAWPIKTLILFGVMVSLWGAAHAGWYPFTAALDQRIKLHTLLRYR